MSHRRVQIGYGRAFLDELNDPFIRLLFAAALLTGVNGWFEGGFRETFGILFTIALTALATSINKLQAWKRYQKALIRPLSYESDPEHGLQPSLMQREVEGLVHIIGFSGFLLAVLSMGFLFSFGYSRIIPAPNPQAWWFALIIFVTVLIGSGRPWIALLYRLFPLVGWEISSHDLFDGKNELSWARSLKSGFSFLVASISFLLLAGLLTFTLSDWVDPLLNQEILRYFTAAVAIMVVAIPDGLGMSIAITLGMGMQQLSRNHTQLREPQVLDTLGAMQLLVIGGKNRSITEEALLPELKDILKQNGIRVIHATWTAASEPTDSMRFADPAEFRLFLQKQRETGLVIGYMPIDDSFLLDQLPVQCRIVFNHLFTIPASRHELVPDAIFQGRTFLDLYRAIGIGRNVYTSIQRFLVFQLPLNIGGLLIEIMGFLLGTPLLLTVSQILWANLIMDVVAPIALSEEKAPDLNEELPLIHRERFLISGRMIEEIAWVSLMLLLGGILLLMIGSRDGLLSETDRASFFAGFILFQFWNLFQSRTFLRQGFFAGLDRNPHFLWLSCLILASGFIIVQFGGEYFQSHPLSLTTWFFLAATTSLLIWAGEFRRLRLFPSD